MKEILKKILVISVFIAINLFSSSLYVDANSINSIDIEIYLEEDGTGHVTEVWDTKFSEGTEAYKPYGNMEYYNITNLKVKDELNKEYETVDNWDTYWDFEEKAYKCGIYESYGRTEICWGMSEYGYKTYTVEYDIEGLVQQLTDAQSIYFTFIQEQMDPLPGSVTITIKSDIAFNEENVKIWAFGYSGSIDLVDGDILMTTDSSLGYYEYMTALVKFEENIFAANTELNRSFDDLKQEAMIDSDYEINQDNTDDYNNININDIEINVDEDFSILEFIYGIVSIIGFIFFTFISGPLFVLIIFILIIYIAAKPRDGQLVFGKNGKNLVDRNNVDYYREIPCNGNVYKGYFLVDNYFSFTYKDDAKSGLMGAIFLKWIKDKRVTIVQTKNGIFDISKNDFALDLSALNPKYDEVEEKLIYMLKEAAGVNEILEAKEFEKWCYSNYSKVNNWFEYATTEAIKEYVRDGAIVEKDTQVKMLFKTKTVKQNVVNPEVKEDATKLLGLRRYLLDYSLIAYREPIEVMLWEDYLVFAQILGIADKVEAQFSSLYPEFNISPDINVSDINKCVNSLTYGGVRAAARAYSSVHSSSSSSRSSGGGGRSSSGGGRSSGGRSSGGGTR